MKELIIKALQTKYPGVDAQIIDRMATKIAKTVTKEEDVQTAVDGVTFQQVLESYGDYRATEATKTSISNYEKKHNLKDGKPVEEPLDGKKGEGEGDDKRKAGSAGNGDGEKPKDEVPEYVKTLMDRIDALDKRQQQQDAERLLAARKAKLLELLKDAPEAIRKVYEDNFSIMKFDDDAKFNEWIGNTKTAVEGIVSDMKQKGAFITPPMAGGGGKPKGEPNPILKKQVEEAKANPNPGQQGAVILGMPTGPNT